MSVYENLKKLNVDIPKAPDPVGAYVAYKKTANLLFISGQISIDYNGNNIVVNMSLSDAGLSLNE